MKELHFSLLETKFLLRVFKLFFNPFVITNKNEIILNFDNERGKGSFLFFTQKNEFLNISFKGKLFEELSFKILDQAKTIYAMYFSKGVSLITTNNNLLKIDSDYCNQIVFKNDCKIKTNISFPAKIQLEFNFMKINNLDSKEESQLVFSHFLNNDVNSFTSHYPLPINNGDVLYSDKVGDDRILDLKNQIVNLKKLHSKQLSKQLKKSF